MCCVPFPSVIVTRNGTGAAKGIAKMVRIVVNHTYKSGAAEEILDALARRISDQSCRRQTGNCVSNGWPLRCFGTRATDERHKESEAITPRTYGFRRDGKGENVQAQQKRGGPGATESACERTQSLEFRYLSLSMTASRDRRLPTPTALTMFLTISIGYGLLPVI
jgi:hypothetical protein